MRIDILAPKHINKYCNAKYENLYFEKIKEDICDATHSVFQIKCTCECLLFSVFRDEHPSVFAKCNKCGNNIVVYDLIYYPCAVKLTDKFTPVKITDEKSDIFEILVMYEYPYYPEEDGDLNDISWCSAWIYNRQNDRLIKILDDETA